LGIERLQTIRITQCKWSFTKVRFVSWIIRGLSEMGLGGKIHSFLPNADKVHRFTGFHDDDRLLMGTGLGPCPGKEVGRKA